MRNIDSVIIRKAILHVLDKNADMPILADYEQEIDEDIHQFIEKHIIKSLNSDENRKGKFRGLNSPVKNASQSILNSEDNFIEASHQIAIQLFKAMRMGNNVPSGDLVICLYEAQEKKYIGILKLDYKKSYIHDIAFEEDKLRNKILPQTIGLPGTGQQLQQCAFIKEFEVDDEFDLIILDKFVPSDEESIQFFSHSFLNCEVLIDERDKTRTFRLLTERWTRKNLRNDIEKAQEVREELIATLKNSADIDIEVFSQNVFGNDVELAQNYLQHLGRDGLRPEKFEIDKPYIEKKMKKRVIKTDTGLEIKGIFEDFEDRMKFEMKRNGDGTVDLVVKNVRCMMEK